MKSSFVVCSLLSCAMFVAFVLSMDSCHETYEIDAGGRLIEIKEDTSQNPPTRTRTERAWESKLAGFEGVQRHVLPGDKVELRRTCSRLPKLDLEMQRLTLRRDGREILVARAGHYRFWGVGIGLSLVPLLCWGIIAVWTVSVPPRRPKAPP